MQAPALQPNAANPDVMTLLLSLSRNMNYLMERDRNLAIHQGDQPLSQADSSSVSEIGAINTTPPISKFDLPRYFKIPEMNAPKYDRNDMLTKWRNTYLFPLTLERNKRESLAAFRSIEHTTLYSSLEQPVRESLALQLARCEELALLESQGSAYASTYSTQMILRAEDNPAVASCHRAALLAQSRSDKDKKETSTSAAQPTLRTRKRKRGNNRRADN